MCVVSMINDDFYEKWNRPYNGGQIVYPQTTPDRQLTQEDVDDLKRLLEKARGYDQRNNEPECEQEEKIERVRKLLTELGFDASFLDEQTDDDDDLLPEFHLVNFEATFSFALEVPYGVTEEMMLDHAESYIEDTVTFEGEPIELDKIRII